MPSSSTMKTFAGVLSSCREPKTANDRMWERGWPQWRPKKFFRRERSGLAKKEQTEKGVRDKRLEAVKELIRQGVNSLKAMEERLGSTEDKDLKISVATISRLLRDNDIVKDSPTGRWLLKEENKRAELLKQLQTVVADHTRGLILPEWRLIPVDRGYASVLAGLLVDTGIAREALAMVPTDTSLILAFEKPIAAKEFDKEFGGLRSNP